MKIFRIVNKVLLIYGFLFLVIAVAAEGGNGKDDTKLTKNITKSFAMTKNAEVDVINKYGKVVITAWDKDSVKVVIDIIAYGKNDDAVDKLMNKVNIEFMKSGDYLAVETEMNRKGGSFGSVLSNIEGYSKTLLNKNKVTIDYTIYMPGTAVLNLENKFGDVFIGNFDGKIDLDISHGDLKARSLNGQSDISLSYGKGRIKNMKSGFLKLKGGGIEIDEGTKINVESSSSELAFGDIKSLLINSRNDKIRAGSLNELKGTGDFTDIFVSNVELDLDLNLEYGEFYAERVGEDFNSITLNSKSTDINLVLSPKSYFNANISGNEDRMIIPNSMLSLGKKDNSDSDFDFTLSGTVGYTRDKIGKVNIKAVSADLIISIKEAAIFTKKN